MDETPKDGFIVIAYEGMNSYILQMLSRGFVNDSRTSHSGTWDALGLEIETWNTQKS